MKLIAVTNFQLFPNVYSDEVTYLQGDALSPCSEDFSVLKLVEKIKRMNSSPQQTVTIAYSQSRVTVFCALLLAQLILISLYYTLSGSARNKGLCLCTHSPTLMIRALVWKVRNKDL